ncbi:Set1/Ash2 histone methyltransferase complex subunit ASH2 [Tyrophagus putrescentiae]|nr:Set1/Ash2 histone methyltransferase complex subunit ASH2 [Tyrophagus putrescentiae]
MKKKKTNLLFQDGNGDSAALNKRQKTELTFPKLPPSGFPTDFPYNKETFRYYLAEPDINAPERKEYEESQDCGKSFPNWLFRRLMPEKVVLSMHDRAPQLKLSDDNTTVVGEKGYSSIRANTGVNIGTWYYEVKINQMPDNSKHFADEGFGVGDVLGCLIDLPRERPFLQKAYKKLPIFKFKSYLYFEEKDDVQKAIKELKPLQDAKIVYYKNGTKIGTAFENIYNGVYYPAAGLFKNISITFNFGPHFDYPPTDTEFGSRYRGMNEAAFDNQIEQTIADMVYLVDNESKGTLSVKNFYTGGNVHDWLQRPENMVYPFPKGLVQEIPNQKR